MSELCQAQLKTIENTQRKEATTWQAESKALSGLGGPGSPVHMVVSIKRGVLIWTPKYCSPN